MPYANNDGVRIYYEVEGEGPPLVLMYGTMMNVDIWHHTGHVEALRNDYRLILIDARGHGASDKSHDPDAYRLPLLVADVVAVLDDLHISKAHYLGFSQGGFIGYGIAKYAAERFHSLIIIDAKLPWKGSPERAKHALELYKFGEGMETCLATLEGLARTWWTPEIRAMHQANDLEAITAMILAEEGFASPGFEDVAPTLTLPCLLFFAGDVDDYPAVRQFVDETPNGIFVSLPGLIHLDAFFRTDLVLPHIRKFLAEVGEG